MKTIHTLTMTHEKVGDDRPLFIISSINREHLENIVASAPRSLKVAIEDKSVDDEVYAIVEQIEVSK